LQTQCWRHENNEITNLFIRYNQIWRPDGNFQRAVKKETIEHECFGGETKQSIKTKINKKMSEQTEPTPVTEGFSEDQVKAIEHVLKGVDIDAISKDEVFIDVVNRLKRFSFEMTVAIYLLEKKTLADIAAQESNEKPEQV
jgi:hypothetical protein